MRLTLYSDYSLRVLLYLAVHPRRTTSAATVAKAFGVSHSHLVKVVNNLGHLGYVHTERGRTGGIRLKVDPANIRIGAVIRQTEPDAGLVECFDPETNTCPIDEACRLKGILAEAHAAFYAVLDKYTLADLLHRPESLIHLLNISATPAVKRGPGGE